MIQKYKQTTCETCLAVSLLQMTNVKINPKLELECTVHSLKFSKEDFVLGHLDFIAKKYNVKIERIVDNENFKNYIEKLPTHKNIINKRSKINLTLINSLLNEGNLILYLDSYYLTKISHYPHFVTVLSKNNGNYTIFDPWDGEEKEIDSKTLSKSISSLNNHLKFCPQIIVKKN